MTDDKSELSKELMEAVKDPKMAHVETKATKSEIILKLKCQKCAHKEDFPVHHDIMMELLDDGKTMKCTHEECTHTQAVAEHCGAVMVPFITGN
jgi:hypothetical protein